MINWSGLDKIGFAPISRKFLHGYTLLNISMEEAMLIIHLLDYVWLGDKPFPPASYFAKLSGKSDQTIRMYFKSLRYKGFLLVVEQGGIKSWDYSPLLKSIRSICDLKVEKTIDKKPKNELEELVAINNKLAIDNSKKRVPVNTKPKHWQRLNSFINKEASQYNSKDLEFVMAHCWSKKGWKSPSPIFGGKDLRHGKELIKIYGADITSQVITHSIENWESLVGDYNINGYPSMSIFWGFRNSIFPKYIDGDLNKDKKPSWGSHFESKDNTNESEVGW